MKAYKRILCVLCAAWVIWLNGCTVQTGLTEATDPVADTASISETAPETEENPAFPSDGVQFTVLYEHLDENGNYPFSLDVQPPQDCSFIIYLTTRRDMTVSLNGTVLFSCEAGSTQRFFDMTDCLSLLRAGENQFEMQGGRGSEMNMSVQIVPGDYSVKASVTPHTEETGFLLEDGLFGINAEITRKGFFGGLSAQMLNNRKLLAGARVPDGWYCSAYERVTDRPAESLCNSNFIILKDGGSMKQTSDVIALANGVEYEAAVWVKAVSDEVSVTFGVEGMEQTFILYADGDMYHKLSFTFTGKDIEKGSFLVSVTGETAVFEVSLMPTDNFYGMRRDVIENLRALHPTSIRYPGGCFADHFLWRESLKDPSFRQPIDGSIKDFMLRDTYGQDCLDIGINEFIMLCREIGAEPEYTVSILTVDGEEARKLVEYCNGNAETEYGAIRQSLGFDAFDIKTWYVGNEVYYFGARYQNDGVRAAEKTSEIVNAMRTADSDIAVVLGVVADTALRTWSEDYISHLTCTYEYISYHRYNGSAPNTEPDGRTACDNLENSFQNDTDAGLEYYANQLFKGYFDNVKICVDEWNFCWGSSSNNALLFSNALEFHFFARNAEKYSIREARFFMPVNEGMIAVNGTESKIESSGELFRLMASHRGGQVIPCESDAEVLDILCTEHGTTVFMSVVNRSATAYTLTFDGYSVSDCTQIKTGSFSFFDNTYAVLSQEAPTVSGHSVLFLTLTPIK